MRSRLLGGLVPLLCVYLACGPLPNEVGSAAPVNRCPEFACQSYGQSTSRCIQSRCEDSVAPAYWLTVSLPRTSFFAAGATFVFPPGSLDENIPRTPDCDKCSFLMPNLQIKSATYRVSPEVASRIGVSLGAEPVAIPIRAHVVPLVNVDLNGQAYTLPATSLGLPVEPFYAEVLQVRGQKDAVVPMFRALLPPMPYQFSLLPEGNLSSLYPPVWFREEIPRVVTLTLLPTTDFVLDNSTLDAADIRTLRLTSADARSFDGYVAYLRERDTKVRVSSRVSLRGENPVVVLETREQKALIDSFATEVVIEPPEGTLAVPRVEVEVNQVVRGLVYPTLPPPVAITGVVSDTNGLAVEGSIAFYSEDVRALSESKIPLDHLRYETALVMDKLGRFSTVLPPGTYTVIATPKGEDLAKTTRVVSIDRSDAISVRVQRKVRVEGFVELSDGIRKVAEARVTLAPSTRLLRREDDVRARWPELRFPRAATSRTNQSGFWFAEVDEGEYDLTVEPEPGSGFPKVVRSLVVCTKGTPNCPRQETTQTVPTIQIAPPVRVTLPMRTPSLGGESEPLIGARVRAFEFRDGAFVEIGESLADSNGNVELLLERARN